METLIIIFFLLLCVVVAVQHWLPVSRWLFSCTSCGWGLFRQLQSWGSCGMKLAPPAWGALGSCCSWCPPKPCLEDSSLSSGKTHTHQRRCSYPPAYKIFLSGSSVQDSVTVAVFIKVFILCFYNNKPYLERLKHKCHHFMCCTRL